MYDLFVSHSALSELTSQMRERYFYAFMIRSKRGLLKGGHGDPMVITLPRSGQAPLCWMSLVEARDYSLCGQHPFPTGHCTFGFARQPGLA